MTVSYASGGITAALASSHRRNDTLFDVLTVGHVLQPAQEALSKVGQSKHVILLVHPFDRLSRLRSNLQIVT